MKYAVFSIISQLVFVLFATGQTASVIIPSNTSTGSLEKNLLFHAEDRYQVTRQGPSITLSRLFDGKMEATGTGTAPTLANPLVILIEGLPNKHIQTAAWIGWSTRYRYPKKFMIEGYNTFEGANTWVTIASTSNYSSRHYMGVMPSGSYTKIRFTFYEAMESSGNGELQLSELFFIHPEAVEAYDGLMVQYSANGNVGIGTADPQAKLAVDGNILANEIKIKTDISVPDYVFEPDYDLPTLSEVEAHIQQHKHLPEIPSAADIQRDGLDLAQMNLLLLKKVEELTLHVIALKKELDDQKALIKTVNQRPDNPVTEAR